MSDGTEDLTALTPTSAVETELKSQLSQVTTKLTKSILVSGAATPDATLRSDFLRRFLLEDVAAANAGITLFTLEDASVKGLLDFEGAKLGLLCRFIRCNFPDGVRLDDCEALGVEFLGSKLERLLANRLTASGSLVCRAVLGKQMPGNSRGPILRGRIESSIELSGAKIRGNVDLRGCTIQGEFNREEGPIAILADGMSVEGSLLLSESFEAEGEIRLDGCQISRNLDCSGATFDNVDGYSLSAAGAHIMGSLYLCRSGTSDTNPKVMPFRSRGELRLAGAQIDGNVDCSSGEFTASCYADSLGTNSHDKSTADDDADDPADLAVAINADGVKIGSDLLFEGEEGEPGQSPSMFKVSGQVSLIKAKIGGDFSCSNARLDFPGGDSLHADGIVVAQSTYLGRKLYTNGFLRFSQASFQGGLYVDEIEFDCDARRRFKIAVDHADDTEEGRCGIYAPCATVKETLIWQGIRKIRTRPPADRLLWVQLASAVTDEIQDEDESWRQIDRFDVARCTYNSLSEMTGDIRERLDQLDRQYALLNPRWYACRTGIDQTKAAARAFALPWMAFWRAATRSGAALDLDGRRSGAQAARPTIDQAIHRFTPQPYLQLAKVVRNAGFEAGAKKILIRLEYNMTMYGDHSLWGFLKSETLSWVMQYGYSPFRPLRILVLWFAISLVVFERGYHLDDIQPTPQNVSTPVVACRSVPTAPAKVGAPCIPAKSGGDPKVSFNTFVFTMETLVPLIDLDQKKNWTVEPLSRATAVDQKSHKPRNLLDTFLLGFEQFPDSLAGAFLFINAFLGWALWSFTAAAVTGLLRRSTDND